jgi:hypothetical protein
LLLPTGGGVFKAATEGFKPSVEQGVQEAGTVHRRFKSFGGVFERRVAPLRVGGGRGEGCSAAGRLHHPSLPLKPYGMLGLPYFFKKRKAVEGTNDTEEEK